MQSFTSSSNHDNIFSFASYEITHQLTLLNVNSPFSTVLEGCHPLALVVIELILFLKACFIAASFHPFFSAKSERNRKKVIELSRYCTVCQHLPTLVKQVATEQHVS